MIDLSICPEELGFIYGDKDHLRNRTFVCLKINK